MHLLQGLVDERPRPDLQRRQVQVRADRRRQDERELALGDVELPEELLEDRVVRTGTRVFIAGDRACLRPLLRIRVKTAAREEVEADG